MRDRRDPERQALRRKLKELGIEGGGIRALMLLPLVYVGWADGRLEKSEIERIRQIARERLHLGSESEKVLEHWLSERPSRSEVEEGLQSLLDLAFDAEVIDVDASELPDLVMHAEAIARSAGTTDDAPLAVS